MKLYLQIVTWLLFCIPAHALEIQKITDNIYALVGELSQRSPENLGNNATFGVIVTDDGVVLVDAGGSRNGAAAINAAIQTITEQPVRFVINSGGQDHRWIGNSFWKEKGATIIASKAAVSDHKDRGSLQMSGLDVLIGEALEGTIPTYADIAFEGEYSFELGGIAIEIFYRGQAHTPGDSYVWVPSADTVFAGDIVYTERILGIGSQSHSGDWIAAFETMAKLDAEHVVPGHGRATDMLTATADTYDYLVNLREKVGAYMDDGGEIIESVNVDQSHFEYLLQFEQLSKRNAQQVFSEMEFE
ncbi:MAG: MBL fold metallo-hydrolase [Paracoccaceae bacterium]